jgi:hypothetical protein
MFIDTIYMSSGSISCPLYVQSNKVKWRYMVCSRAVGSVSILRPSLLYGFFPSGFYRQRCSVVVKALSYKLEGRWFVSQWGEYVFFNLPNPSSALGPGVYPASNRNECQRQKNNFYGSRARPVRKADNLAAICDSDCLDNVGSLTSHTTIGLHGLIRR